MFNYNPIAAHPQHAHSGKLITEKMIAHDPQIKQTAAEMQDKAVQGLNKFPADSAFISEEAKRAFREKDEIRRRKKESFDQEKQKKKKKKNKFQAYLDAMESEGDL